MRRLILWLGILSADCTLITGALNAVCGDGFKNNDEECDDGDTVNDDGCDEACRFEVDCGDGVSESGEGCDDGNSNNNDACLNSCRVASCGDGFIQSGDEQCDDGNTANGDGCSAICQEESGFTCDGEPSVCTDTSLCNNGVVDTQNGEECEDGNNVDNDNCKNNCTFPDIVQIQAGTAHTCARDQFGRVYCWGAANLGQLGYGNNADIGDTEHPAVAGAVPLGFGGRVVVDLSVGSTHNCGVLDDDEIFCWGNGANGRLGYGNINNIGDDESAADGGELITGVSNDKIFSGGGHTCLLSDVGDLLCWGQNNSGQLGQGDTVERDDPLSATAINIGNSNGILQVALGGEHTCALLANGGVRCWGKGTDGQLGNKSTDNIDSEIEMQALSDLIFSLQESPAQKITAGRDHSCALLSNGDLHCWGKNNELQLGLGNVGNIGDGEAILDVSRVFEGSTIDQITAGDQHTCARFNTGDAVCWGRNAEGQAGYPDLGDLVGDDPDELPENLPPISLGNNAIIQITAGGTHTCVRLAGGSVRCWGGGSSGQLGNSSSDNVFAPPVDDISIY